MWERFFFSYLQKKTKPGGRRLYISDICIFNIWEEGTHTEMFQCLSAVSILKMVATVNSCDIVRSEYVVLVIWCSTGGVVASFFTAWRGAGGLFEAHRAHKKTIKRCWSCYPSFQQEYWSFEEISEGGVKTSAGRVELRELAGWSTTSVSKALLLLWVLSSIFLIMSPSVAVLVGASPVGSSLVQAENT